MYMDKILIGNIKKSVGLNGYFRFNSTNPSEPEYLLKLINKEVFIEQRKMIVEDIIIKNDILIKFKLINEPDKFFSNKPVYTDRANAIPLEPGEYYYADLEKCKVKIKEDFFDVVAVLDFAGQTMIEIKVNSKTVYVPMNFIISISIEDKLIIADEIVLE